MLFNFSLNYQWRVAADKNLPRWPHWMGPDLTDTHVLRVSIIEEKKKEWSFVYLAAQFKCVDLLSLFA